ncbi:MAG: TonB-dependent receptor domain-containing protein [Bryobacteraceae bacterium]
MSHAKLYAALAALLLSGTIHAQITGGSFTGLVTDPSNAIIADAEVEARNVATNVASRTVTTASGYYEFPLLPAGRYVISVRKSGFQKATTAELVLNSGTRPRVDLALQIGEITQSVEVVGATPVVNASTTDLGVVVDAPKIRELPLNGRTFTQLLALQPGYNTGSATAGRGGVELNGLSGLGNNWLMDGIDMSLGENNGVGQASIAGTGTVINTVSIEALEEFKTTSGAFSAEFGRATGGVINLTTRSGTNAFHGTLFEFLRNDKLDANSYFSNRAGLRKPVLRHNQFGGNLGGPILRNRLFFFFNYEGARIRRATQVTGNVPTPALLSRVTNPALAKFLDFYPKTFEPTPNPLVGLHRRNDGQQVTEDTTLSRIDLNVASHRISYRLVWNDQQVSNPALPLKIRGFVPIPVRNWAVSDSIAISPTKFNELRFGYNHYPVARHTRSTDPADNTTVPGLSVPLTRDGRCVAPAGLSAICTVDSLAADTPTYMFVDNFTWIRGPHTFKTGFELRHIDSIRTQYGQGVWHFYNSLDDFAADRIDRLELPFGNPGGGYKFWTTAGYFQDDWRVTRRLQINLGLRYEYYTVFKGSIGLATRDPYGPRTNRGDPIWQPDRNNFAPRAGVIFDVFGSGKTILRLGGGITYGAPQPFFYYDAAWIDARVPFAPIVNVVDIPDSLKPLRFPFPDSFLEEVRKDPSRAPRGLTPGYLAADPGRRDEYSGQWNLSIQQAVTKTFAVQATYVGNRALKMYTSRLINPIDPRTGVRPRADIGPAWYQENGGRLWSHGLQLSANKRMSRGLTFDAFYTWSKTMQYHNADAAFTRDGGTQDPFNIAGSMGPKQGELRHRFTLVHSYEIPTLPGAQGHALGRAVLGGWTVQGILTARSGLPLNIVQGRDVVGNGNSGPQRPDAVGGVNPRVEGPDRLVWLTPAAFDGATPARERRFGSLGYNTARGPGGLNWDAAVHKFFPVREGHRVAFRFEMFNWMNHVVLNNPSVSLADPNFGRVTSASGGRNIQFGLKYVF